MSSETTCFSCLFAGPANASTTTITAAAAAAGKSSIAALTQEINYYNRYKELIQKKFDQKHLLRYKCELNFLKKLIDTKQNELKALMQPAKTTKPMISIRRDPKIFYSKSYLARMDRHTAAMSDEDKRHHQKENHRIRSEYDLDDFRTVWQKRSSSGCYEPSLLVKNDVKIFYSKKYRAKLLNAEQKRKSLAIGGGGPNSISVEQTAAAGATSESENQKQLSQFERFKNMYLKWLQSKN